MCARKGDHVTGTSTRAAAAVLVVATSLMVSGFDLAPAFAGTAPDLACGNTQPGPCTETAHFSEINEMNAPAPPGGGCPTFATTDFATFVGTGNGIEHITVNKAQDLWFTSTFTGTMTITPYLHGTVDSDGNVTSVSDVDPNVPPFTGKVTEWFGGSFNQHNAVEHNTIHFAGTNADGEMLRFHDPSHSAWTPGTDMNGPPNKMFDKLRCS
jgi:hypothetical protein